ncbi:MAG: aldo/keto reductase [Methanobacteriaceae archaeon]|nr:aldo/keto reductase [Methanobacteriaceae archaeon]
MRLPLKNKEDQESVDQEEVNKMVKTFMDNEYTYFDTAYPYHNGLSEKSLKKALVDKYPRDSFQLADKLPLFFITKEEQMESMFNEQLERCGVDYFDYYMLHNVSKWTEKAFTDIDSFKFILDKKAEGKIKHAGISYHDDAKFLENILKKHANDIDFIQLQINYIDWENDGIQAKECYELSCKYEIPVIVMEPLKGGSLVDIPKEAEKLFKEYNSERSNAGWALNYCQNLDNVFMVLSGVSNNEHVIDNIKNTNDFKKLTPKEYEIIDKVKNIINSSIAVTCTECGYCLETCPKNILISKFFALYNTEKRMPANGFSPQEVYYNTLTLKEENGKASDCIECNLCVEHCPQHLDIPKYLKDVTQLFEVDLVG